MKCKYCGKELNYDSDCCRECSERINSINNFDSEPRIFSYTYDQIARMQGKLLGIGGSIINNNKEKT